MNIAKQNHPNLPELNEFFELAFQEGNTGQLHSEDMQTLSEWFSVKAMIEYLTHGALLEVREMQELIGAIFVGRQNPISWPDGKKAEIFILAVKASHRNQGIGKSLLLAAENAARDLGAKTIMTNTHIDLTNLHQYYQNQGY